MNICSYKKLLEKLNYMHTVEAFVLHARFGRPLDAEA